jgi:hypothetical protein
MFKLSGCTGSCSVREDLGLNVILIFCAPVELTERALLGCSGSAHAAARGAGLARELIVFE